MNLKTQVFSLIFSFFYGGLFSVLVNINYYFIFNRRKLFRIAFTITFVFIMSLLYFYILNIINNGIVHVYFFLLILIGFYIGFPYGKKLRSLVNKCKVMQNIKKIFNKYKF